MKIKHSIVIFAGLLIAGFASAVEQSLFNGKDLTGWEGEPGWWYVEDGAITSESTPEKPCAQATYLVWTGGEPGDFELTLDFKLGPSAKKVNSGVQIRSERRPNWDTYGYQADMTALGGLSGYVYHQGRGLIAAKGERVHIDAEGTRTAEPLPEIQTIQSAFKPGEWNQYRILCDGPMIRLFINGVMVCEFTDEHAEEARSEGIIALQMHPGPPMKVQFKNIVLKSFDTSSDAKWIAVLDSDADVAAKRAACRELAVTGTAAAVPALAELLRDAKLSHMARFALEHIPGAAADAALIDALDDSEGEALAALIGSIGVRRIDEADTALLKFLKHSDPAVVQAAANALGRLATDRSIAGLLSAWESAGSDQRSLLIAGMLAGAERLQEAGGNEAANALYLQVWETAAEAEPMRNGALIGAIQTGGAQGQQLLLDCLHGEDAAQAQLTLRTALSVNTAETAETLMVALGELQPERQVLIIGFLADMDRFEQVPTLFEYAEAADSAVRVAAIRALGRLGAAGTAELYLKLMQDSDTQVALAASEGLTGLATDDADTVIVAGLKDADAAFTVQLLGMIAQRRLKSELPALQALMDSEDVQVRLAAIESYGELAEVEQLPVLLTAIETRTDAADIQALGKAIAQVCILADAPEVCLPLLKSSEAVAVPEAKSMLGKVIQRIERAS